MSEMQPQASRESLLEAPTSERAVKAHRETLGILFLHYTSNDVVLNNLSSVRKYNPEATLLTMSAGRALPNGYTLQATPEVQKLHARQPDRSSDWLVCSWFLQHKEQCDKWWIIEWDTYCAESARNYYAPVWHFPFVASSVRLPYREPEWFWFPEVQNLPGQYKPYLMGAVPFLYLVSDSALKHICTALLEVPVMAGNGELRFATAANQCGFAPCGYSPPGDQITWIPWPALAKCRTIFHPVKFLVRHEFFSELEPAGSLPEPEHA